MPTLDQRERAVPGGSKPINWSRSSAVHLSADLSAQHRPLTAYGCTLEQAKPLPTSPLTSYDDLRGHIGAHRRIRARWAVHESHNPKVVGSNPTPATT